MPDDVKVTQADRKAAADYLTAVCRAMNPQSKPVTRVRRDHPCLLAFARHRIAAEQRGREQGQADERARVVAALEKRWQLYMAKAAKKDPFADENWNNHDVAMARAEAMEYAAADISADHLPRRGGDSGHD